MSDKQKIKALLKNAMRILHDECPDDNKVYICMRSEDYDPDMCMTCWDNYLRSILKG